MVARNNTVIKQLVLEAKKMYEKDAEHRIHVFIPDTWGCWRWNGSRQKRPLDSVVLESSVKDMIVADCKDFMNSEEVRWIFPLFYSAYTDGLSSGTRSAVFPTVAAIFSMVSPGLARLH